MTDKTKAIELLTKEGYDARLESGVVMVYHKTMDEEAALSFASEIRDFLFNAGYNASFGTASIPS